MKASLQVLIGAVILGIIIPVELYLFHTIMQRYPASLAMIASPTIQWITITVITLILAFAGIKIIYDGIIHAHHHHK